MRRLARLILPILALLLLAILAFGPARRFTRDFLAAFSIPSGKSATLPQDMSASSLQPVPMRMARLEKENSDLRSICKIASPRGYKVVAAEVTSRDPRNWMERMIVGKGEADGVSEGMVVLAFNMPRHSFKAAYSIAGRVLETSRHTAEIATIYDRDFTLSAAIGEEMAPAVIMGGPEPRLEYFNPNLVGDGEQDVRSSEFSTVCPPHVPAGSVSTVAAPDAFTQPTVLPFIPWADVSEARFVIILVPDR